MTGTEERFRPVPSEHVCPVCGRSFTVCPPDPRRDRTCLAVDCESYDPALDVELWWESLPIRRIPL